MLGSMRLSLHDTYNPLQFFWAWRQLPVVTSHESVVHALPSSQLFAAPGWQTSWGSATSPYRTEARHCSSRP